MESSFDSAEGNMPSWGCRWLEWSAVGKHIDLAAAARRERYASEGPERETGNGNDQPSEACCGRPARGACAGFGFWQRRLMFRSADCR